MRQPKGRFKRSRFLWNCSPLFVFRKLKIAIQGSELKIERKRRRHCTACCPHISCALWLQSPTCLARYRGFHFSKNGKTGKSDRRRLRLKSCLRAYLNEAVCYPIFSFQKLEIALASSKLRKTCRNTQQQVDLIRYRDFEFSESKKIKINRTNTASISSY